MLLHFAIHHDLIRYPKVHVLSIAELTKGMNIGLKKSLVLNSPKIWTRAIRVDTYGCQEQNHSSIRNIKQQCRDTDNLYNHVTENCFPYLFKQKIAHIQIVWIESWFTFLYFWWWQSF